MKQRKLVKGSLNCIAGGTFIFIVFLEMIPENMKIDKPGKNIISVFAGFTLIAIIQIFI